MALVRESQDAFVAARQGRWNELDTLLSRGKELFRLEGDVIARVAMLYRSLCSDLMRCRSAGYTPDLVGYLNALAGRAHNSLYGARAPRVPAFFKLVIADFPRTLRANGAFFLLSLALFGIPCALGVLGGSSSTAFAEEVIPAPMLRQMVEAYSGGFGEGRGAGQDAGMAGFYVYNNVGIAFRCFATGVLFGAGSMFFLVYNGLVIGTVTGYVVQAGHGHNMLTFMCGHAPFELTAIVISGAAGLRMGYALIATAGRTRFGSLRLAAPEIARLVVGAAVMLLIAAGIEAFWSPSAAAAPAKWAVSGIGWTLVTAYLALAGRGPGARA